MKYEKRKTLNQLFINIKNEKIRVLRLTSLDIGNTFLSLLIEL